MTRKEAIQMVDIFQKWRVGDLKETMDELGLKPRLITESIDIVLSIALEKITEDEQDEQDQRKLQKLFSNVPSGSACMGFRPKSG